MLPATFFPRGQDARAMIQNVFGGVCRVQTVLCVVWRGVCGRWESLLWLGTSISLVVSGGGGGGGSI